MIDFLSGKFLAYFLYTTTHISVIYLWISHLHDSYLVIWYAVQNYLSKQMISWHKCFETINGISAISHDILNTYWRGRLGRVKQNLHNIL